MNSLSPFILIFLFSSVSISLFGKPVYDVVIGTRHAQLRFSNEVFAVKPGSRVNLTLDNTDEMIHNLVLSNGDSSEINRLAELALKLGEHGMKMGFVPKDPSIIASIGLVQPGGKSTVQFIAPLEKGDYSYVCTFPGHSLTMRGVMKVVDDPSSVNLAEIKIASPPFTKMVDWSDGGIMTVRIVFDNFLYIINDSLYVDTYFNSVKIASTATIISLLLGYPIAYGIVRSGPIAKPILLFMVILPFWTSFLLRVYAWMGLLADQGTINNLLISLGFINEPIRMLYTEFAVYIGIVYTYMPFMILPLYANMEKLDGSLNEAAADLGSKPINTFFKVTLPLTMPGVIAGSLLVFIPATGEYVIPDLLGGGNVQMIGRVLFNEFSRNTDWPVASAVAIAMLFLLVLPIIIFQYYQGKAAEDK